MDLNPLRDEINRIDSDLVKLLDRRAEIARLVGESKAQAGATTFDAGRAKAVVHQALSRSNGQFPKEGMIYVFREILSACLNLQKSLRIGFMGPRDTYSHLAAIREFGSSVEFVPFKVIRDVFIAVENGDIDYGIVPIENSNGGTVHLTLDAFIEHPCRVCSEVLLPIHLSILGHTDLGAIRKLYSHPQPFLQCDRWLKANLPHVIRQEMDSTTQGMIEAKKDPFAAAIGNELAADEYGLRVLAKNVEDSDENTTRFLVISKTDAHASGDDKTSIMFSVADRPGALLRVLKPFDDLKINLSKLESRPTKRRAWEQAFFVDADGHRNDAAIQNALEEIRPHCENVVVLGSYPRDKSPREIQKL